MAGWPALLCEDFWHQKLQTMHKGMICCHQAHPRHSQPGYQQVQAMRCMALATINCDFTGSTTQRMPTPALMSPEGQKGHSNPALPLQWEAQALTTLSVHSTNAGRSLRLDQKTQYPPTGKPDSRSTCLLCPYH
jgi:hypothetical protein